MTTETVGICLMKSDEADATITHLLDQTPDLRVEDHVTYFRVMTEQDILIDLREVSAYFGQIDVDDTVLRVSSVSPNGDVDGPSR